MDKFVFNWKYKDFEIRTTRFPDEHPYIELVKWVELENKKKYCYTLAYFHRNKCDISELHFVGDRPLTEIAEMDLSEIWKQLWLAQMMFEDAEKRLEGE